MDFFASLLVLASSQGISEHRAMEMHQNYCQNLYWQPDATEKLQQAHCDILQTDREVRQVKSGKY